VEKEKAMRLFTEWEPVLGKTLAILPYSQQGLVYNDPANPHSPYGFTDCIAKTGELFMESLLCWRAFRAMESMSRLYGRGDTVRYVRQAAAIEQSVGVLFDEESGMFLAATEDCRQIDIWGNAYMLYIGFPCGADRSKRVVRWLLENIASYIYEGQIRHLPAGQYWERMLANLSKEIYQNGAYWATATGWIIWSIADENPELAADIFAQAVRYCLENGFYEYINRNSQAGKHYAASGTNLLGAASRFKREGNQRFLKRMDELCKNI
jgi:hypothetical protein